MVAPLSRATRVTRADWGRVRVCGCAQMGCYISMVTHLACARLYKA
jgi:hypothetical protein